MERPERKLNRLTNYDYSRNGLYFITICTKDRIRYLSDIIDVGNAVLGVPTASKKAGVGDGVLDVPTASKKAGVGNGVLGVPRNIPNISMKINHELNDIIPVPVVKLTKYGDIVNDNIKKINEIYRYVSVEKYVIMPDHIHMILFVSDFEDKSVNYGTPRAAFPTKSVSQIINGLKAISTKQIGFSVWQKSFHDHIIRNEKEFLEICDYIDNNPINWVNDIYNQNYWR